MVTVMARKMVLVH